MRILIINKEAVFFPFATQKTKKKAKIYINLFF